MADLEHNSVLLLLLHGYAWEAIKLLISLFAKQIIVGLLLLAHVLGSRDIAVNKTEKISCLLVADRLLFSVSMESLNL